MPPLGALSVAQPATPGWPVGAGARTRRELQQVKRPRLAASLDPMALLQLEDAEVAGVQRHGLAVGSYFANVSYGYAGCVAAEARTAKPIEVLPYGCGGHGGGLACVGCGSPLVSSVARRPREVPPSLRG